MKLNIYQQITIAYFAFVVGVWLDIAIQKPSGNDARFMYSFIFGLVPLFGGLAGMFKASVWGGLKSTLGKAIFFISLGLVLWGSGETIWSYYNVVRHVAAPYPSLADLGFAPSIFFWVLGTVYLSKATGAYFALKKSHWAKIFAIAVPLILLIPSYYLQVHVARGGVVVPDGESALKATLDIVYPFGDFLALTFAAVVYILSYKYFGGRYRGAVTCLLAGLATMYAGDLIFAYTTTKDTYQNGDVGDLVLATGLFFITVGILAFATKPSAAVTTKKGAA